MPTVLLIIKRFLEYTVREKLHRLFLLVLAVIFLGSFAFAYVEKEMNILGALWWAVVTVTTVGYGDITPSTLSGKIIGVIIMFFGIGLTGILTATLAGFFIEEREMKKKGLKAVDEVRHFIICGWNERGEEIYEELRADLKTHNKSIVLIADIDESPRPEDKFFYFVKGEPNKETLKKANCKEADTVIVLLDDRLDPYSQDAKVILTTLTIKSLYPESYVCVELKNSKNLEYLKNARADEIIIGGEISAKLLVQAALDHGVTEVVSELLTNRYGNEFYLIPVPSSFIGKNFLDVLMALKKEHNILCLGVFDNSNKRYLANPSPDHLIKEKDKLVVIASNRPKFE